jgi:branched-chain amino acid transport system substrate-binding protein
MADNGGTKPTDEQLAAAMNGLAWDAPSGRVEMALAGGHQAIQPNAIGTTKWNTETGKMELVDIEYYNARCVNPPEGMKSSEWLAQGFPGAQCD